MTVVDVATGEVESVLTAEQARRLTDQIRGTLRSGHDLIVQAFKGRAWSALGYESWDAYCAGEFAEARMVRLDRAQRREIAAEMHDAGMSNRLRVSEIETGRAAHLRLERVPREPQPHEAATTEGRRHLLELPDTSPRCSVTAVAHRPVELAGILADPELHPLQARCCAELALDRDLTAAEAARLDRNLAMVRAAVNPEAASFARHALNRTVRQFCAVPR